MADDLNSRVEFSGLVTDDEVLFGGQLPTTRLQNWFYDGNAGAFEVAMYGVYMLHFVVPFALAFLIWRLRPQHYWNYVTSIVVTHDMKSALRIGDRIAMLYGGEFIAVGPPEDFRDPTDERVRQFVEGLADGPIPLRISKTDYLSDLLGVEQQNRQ